MQAAVAVHEGMDVYESEGDRASGDHRVHATFNGALAVVDDAPNETLEILGTYADMLGDGFLRGAIVRTNKPAFVANPEAHESVITDHNALKTFELDSTVSSFAIREYGMTATVQGIDRFGSNDATA